jgi:archaemetzincin
MGLWTSRTAAEREAERFQDVRISVRRIAILMVLYFLVLFTGIWIGRQLFAPTPRIVRTAALKPDYYLPVDSRSLTVAIQPLVPGPQAAAVLGRVNSGHAQAAAALVAPAGLEALADSLAALYPLSYEIVKPVELPDEFFDVERQQYDVDLALNWLVKQADPHYFRTLGVTSADIYKGEYNFLFGLAKLGGSSCISSCARTTGTTPGELLTPAKRWHSIVRHEMGHTLGLQHVEDQQSVMAYGNSLEELDQQGTELTKADWKLLKNLHPIRWAGR